MGALRDFCKIACVGTLGVTATPTIAENTLNSSMGLSLSFLQPKEKKPQYIDRHVVFVIDRSGSMDSNDLTIVKDSIIESFENSEDVNFAFSSGNVYAITFVSFANSSHASKTFIVRNVEQARKAVYTALLDPNNGNGFFSYEIGSDTYLNAGLLTARLVFDSERMNGIQSLSKAVVILADDKPTDAYVIPVTKEILEKAYQASLSCVPIVSPETIIDNNNLDVEFFKTVVTGYGVKITNAYGGYDRLQEGQCAPASNAKQGVRTIAHALALSGG